jgi:hypothetical protein
MSDALKLWLRESWELWYWAMFCPSRLQERMNEWSPAEERDGIRPDTTFQDMLLYRLNWRFLFQFIQITCFFSFPLVAIIPIYGRFWDLLLLPVILLTTYSGSVWFEYPIGLNVPLIFIAAYLAKPTFFVAGLKKAIEVLPPISQIGLGLLIGALGIVFTNVLWLPILKRNLLLARSLLIAGSTLSILVGSWIYSQNWLLSLVIGGLSWGFLFLMRDSIKSNNDALNFVFMLTVLLASIVAFIVTFHTVRFFAFIVAFNTAGIAFLASFSTAGIVANILAYANVESFIALGIAIFVAFFISLGIAGGVASISTLPLYTFLFLCWLAGVSLSPYRQKWLGLIAAVVLTTLGIEYQNWRILLTFPITLIGYYRLLPDFAIFTVLILPTTSSISSPIRSNPFQLLRLLPPFTSELLWLPLPNHDRILIAAFRQNPLEALSIFQSIQKQPIYGFQQTIKKALPQLVADQLIVVQTIPELIATATTNHAILPLLVPSLYQTELIDSKSLNVKFLPTFQKFAQDTDAALQAGSIALRERGLERILDQLSTLKSQLSGLVKSKSIPRWQNVIKQWQTVIQQELEQLQRQSQGEILNPFQYGNPLTLDRAQLFKGRSAFADQIVRQILDRNRPTIILHGPRRCGKSSFLLNLPRLLTSDVLPVYIDLQSQSASQSEADFCFTIVRAIHRDARSQQVPLPAPPKREEFRLSPYTQLEDWLDTALTQLGDRRILLNIDEFEAIGTAMEQGRISTNLFDELRSLIQHWDRLSFLFSGVQTLDELGTNWSSYFISAMPIEMTYLNPNEARELLLNPDPEFTLAYDTGIVDQILTLTRCHPYLLQLLGWVLVQLANTTHTQLVTPTLLQSAIPEAYINGIGYFTNVWEQFTGTSPTEITAGQQQLLALAQGQQPHPTNESSQKSLQRMLRYHIIEKINNQYKFEVPLIERWVREKSI